MICQVLGVLLLEVRQYFAFDKLSSPINERSMASVFLRQSRVFGPNIIAIVFADMIVDLLCRDPRRLGDGLKHHARIATCRVSKDREVLSMSSDLTYQATFCLFLHDLTHVAHIIRA